VIRVAENPKGAKETDLLEKEASEMPVQERTIEMPVSKHEIKTIKMIMQK
jgi:hypothetical protein